LGSFKAYLLYLHHSPPEFNWASEGILLLRVEAILSKKFLGDNTHFKDRILFKGGSTPNLSYMQVGRITRSRICPMFDAYDTPPNTDTTGTDTCHRMSFWSPNHIS